MKGYDTYPAWVCTCCFIALVNGDRCQCDDEDPTQHPQGLMGLMVDAEPTSGMLNEYHHCDRDMFDGCDCETDQFSWSSCDGCGTHLGGERHAVTGWIKI